MPDLLRLSDRTSSQLERLLARIGEPPSPSVAGRRVALLWNGLAMRNRAALDLAAADLRLVCVEAKSVLGGRESARDLAAYLDNWFDASVVRGAALAQLSEFARWSRGSVINAGGPDSHPTEVLSDLAYLADRYGTISGLTLGFVGPATNVLASWLQAASRLDMRVIQVAPATFWAAAPSVAAFQATEDPAGLADADVVYTDCWWPVRLAAPENKDALLSLLSGYRLSGKLLSYAAPDTPVLHGPPVTPGLEIDADLLDDPRYVAWTAKRWLLPTMTAVLTEALGG
jgi:ornithine carbamoyltransferase